MDESREFDPESVLRVLAQHGVAYVLIGGLAASLHGSPYLTTDVDIAPSKDGDNLGRLALALTEMDARIRVAGEPEGVPFDRSAAMLAGIALLNLTTRFGDLDIAFVPSGTGGYADLRRGAGEIAIRDIPVTLASLSDVIRSKEAAGREKDRVVLPTLRRLLERSEQFPENPS